MIFLFYLRDNKYVHNLHDLHNLQALSNKRDEKYVNNSVKQEK